LLGVGPESLDGASKNVDFEAEFRRRVVARATDRQPQIPIAVVEQAAQLFVVNDAIDFAVAAVEREISARARALDATTLRALLTPLPDGTRLVQANARLTQARQELDRFSPFSEPDERLGNATWSAVAEARIPDVTPESRKGRHIVAGRDYLQELDSPQRAHAIREQRRKLARIPVMARTGTPAQQIAKELDLPLDVVLLHMNPPQRKVVRNPQPRGPREWAHVSLSRLKQLAAEPSSGRGRGGTPTRRRNSQSS
jgi:hypothetical protein